jgi:hypothetical protein
MPELLKLARLPDRTPIKVVVHVPPDLHRALEDYAGAYATAYGSTETIATLIPYMLQTFMESDRSFARSRKS